MTTFPHFRFIYHIKLIYFQLTFFVDSIFKHCVKTPPGEISLDAFTYVGNILSPIVCCSILICFIVAVQPQIMQRFKARNNRVDFNQKCTFFYWALDCDRSNRCSEMIFIKMDKQGPRKQGQISFPLVE